VLFKATHTVSDVVRKQDSGHNPWHAQVIGRQCFVILLDTGERGWLAVNFSYDPNHFHRFHLSEIQSIESDDNGMIHIETENTYYTLSRLKEGEAKTLDAGFDPKDYESWW